MCYMFYLTIKHQLSSSNNSVHVHVVLAHSQATQTTSHSKPHLDLGIFSGQVLLRFVQSCQTTSHSKPHLDLGIDSGQVLLRFVQSCLLSSKLFLCMPEGLTFGVHGLRMYESVYSHKGLGLG
jgi:hypothetical protein